MNKFIVKILAFCVFISSLKASLKAFKPYYVDYKVAKLDKPKKSNPLLIKTIYPWFLIIISGIKALIKYL